MHIPSVTIIIPCFNASSYIEKCLSELNNQHYRDFEVICVDDASSDNTVEVIDNYKHNASFNIRIIKNESNVGPAVSRNRGVCAANTKYITFCDSDDWYDSWGYGWAKPHQGTFDDTRASSSDSDSLKYLRRVGLYKNK